MVTRSRITSAEGISSGFQILLERCDAISRRFERRGNTSIKVSRSSFCFFGATWCGNIEDRAELRGNLDDSLRRRACARRQPESAQRLPDGRSLMREADSQARPEWRVEWIVEREHDLPGQAAFVAAGVDAPASRGRAVARLTLGKKALNVPLPPAESSALIALNRRRREGRASRRPPGADGRAASI